MKLYVGVPTYHNMTTGFAVSIFTTDLGFDHEVHFLEGDPYIGRARDVIAANFLESDCTHLLFMDADLIFNDEHIRRLVGHSKKMIVGGFYPKKQLKLEWVCQPHPHKPEAGKDGLMDLMYLGTGFMLIARQVFDGMKILYGKELAFTDEMHPDKRTIWDFFSVGVHRPSGRYLSEDWWFCQRALDMGYKIYGDTKCVLQHIGHAVYPIVAKDVVSQKGQPNS